MSILYPWIRAWAAGAPLDHPAPTASGPAEIGAEVWFLSRAASGGCDLALRRRPDLDAVGLASEISGGVPGGTAAGAALIEDLVVALTRAKDDGHVDTTRLRRDDPLRLWAALIQIILGAAELLAAVDGAPPEDLVDLFFAAARGTEPPDLSPRP